MKEIGSTINLVVHGRTPSKKNSKQIIYVRGKPLIISSKDYAEWHKISLQTLKNAPRLSVNIEVVRLTFYSENKRKFDLSNKAESIMDLLVDAGILLDDNYEVVPKLILEYGGISKENPRCEIEIKQTSI
jgi:Holliday junction resolvase RusA-like endonuclease